MDLSAKIAGLDIEPAIMNASGIFSYPQVLKRLSTSGFGALVTKSIGLEPREGFIEPVLADADCDTYINAMGLPNPGCEAASDELSKIYPLAKPLICSIFGANENEIADVAAGLEGCCDAFELNFSCPNIGKGEKCGMTIGKDPELVSKYTRMVREKSKKPIIVKLTPNVDAETLQDAAKAAQVAGADAISAANTVSPGMVIDIFARKPILTAKFGGVSGRGIKPIGIAAVYNIFEVVKIPIIGIGGIRQAEDIVEYVEAGAEAVAVGTAFAGMSTNQIGAHMEKLKVDLQTILDRLCISSLKELKGAAHEV